MGEVESWVRLLQGLLSMRQHHPFPPSAGSATQIRASCGYSSSRLPPSRLTCSSTLRLHHQGVTYCSLPLSRASSCRQAQGTHGVRGCWAVPAYTSPTKPNIKHQRAKSG